MALSIPLPSLVLAKMPRLVIVILLSVIAGCVRPAPSLEQAGPGSITRSMDPTAVDGLWQYETFGSAMLTRGVLRLSLRQGSGSGLLVDNSGRVNAQVTSVQLDRGNLIVQAATSLPERINIVINAEVDGDKFYGTIRTTRMQPGNDINNRQEAAQIEALRSENG